MAESPIVPRGMYPKSSHILLLEQYTDLWVHHTKHTGLTHAWGKARLQPLQHSAARITLVCCASRQRCHILLRARCVLQTHRHIGFAPSVPRRPLLRAVALQRCKLPTPERVVLEPQRAHCVPHRRLQSRRIGAKRLHIQLSNRCAAA